MTINVTNASDADANGTALSVTVASPTTFTYTRPSDPTSGTLDYATSCDKVHTLGANVTTVSAANEPGSGKSQIIKLLLIGASTYTLPASWADVDWWIPGSAPTAPAAGKRQLVTLWAINVAGTVHCIGNYSTQP